MRHEIRNELIHNEWNRIDSKRVESSRNETEQQCEGGAAVVVAFKSTEKETGTHEPSERSGQKLATTDTPSSSGSLHHEDITIANDNPKS